MKQIMCVIILALLFPGLLSAEEPQTLRMKIEGMTCGACAAKVKRQLSSLCKEVTINLEKGEGICQYEASVTPDQIVEEANKTGFKTSKTN